MKKIVLYLMFVLIILSPAFARSDYYVDSSNGSDSNNGLSPASAWKTISKVNNSSFNPGDNIYFKRNETWRETLVIPSSGSTGYPITFGAYGNGYNPIINGADLIKGWSQYSTNIWQAICSIKPLQVFFDETKGSRQNTINELDSQNDWYWNANSLYIYTTSAPDNTYSSPGIEASTRILAVDLNGKDYLTFDGLCLQKTNSNLFQTGLKTCINITIQNCTLTYGGGCAMAFYTNSTNWVIANNEISYCGKEQDRDSIFAYGGCDNLSIYGNTIHHSGGDAINVGNMGDIDTVNIYNNTIRDSASISIGIVVESYLITGPVNIYQNTIYNHDLGEIVIKGSNVKIFQNNIYGGVNQKSDSILCNHENANKGLEIYYNLIHSRDINGSSGIALWVGGSNSRIYNNVIYDVHDGIGLYNKENVIVKNNIIFGCSGYGIKASPGYSAEIAYNCVYENIDGNYNPTVGNRTGSGGNMSYNPSLTNPVNDSFSLQSTSPCIDAGTNVGLSQDYQGTSVPQSYSPDIGAFEYTGSEPLDTTINASPTSGWAPLSVSFSESTSGGISPYSYSWDFGDGNTSSEQNPSHTFSDAGEYTVTLTVTDNDDSQVSDSLIISVSKQNDSLSASASASPASGQAPLEVSFTGEAGGGTSPYSYSWDFGDGNTSSEQNPSHTFSEAGEFTVTLTVTDDDDSQISDSLFIDVNQSGKSSPMIEINRSSLYFGSSSGNTTSSQNLMISNSGDGTINWTVSSDVSWLSCSPETGAGSSEVTISVNASGLEPGTYVGIVTVSDTNASNSPQTIDITLKVYSSKEKKAPIGSFDTPINGSTVRSSVPITGWALDDIEVENVKIYRNPVAGEGNKNIYIGDAVFVEGSRPDIETAYPEYPLNYQGGWGYMMLTNFLPNKGNGSFVIHAVATDKSGNQVTLGSKTITCDNKNAVKPFGAIDTPQQGGTASGSNYVNSGWVLTPLPNTIPADGSTIKVIVDGVNIGNPSYNQYREDIADRFPEYNNSTGAAGNFPIDTTAYENGIHTIAWAAEDSAGNVAGIDSRYFKIFNESSTDTKTLNHPKRFDYPNSFESLKNISPSINPIDYSIGYKKQSKLLAPDKPGHYQIEINEVQPLVISLNPSSSANLTNSSSVSRSIPLSSSSSYYSAFMIVNNGLRPLPIGSSFDSKTGLFSWHPGPGFLGEYEFVFIKENSLYKEKLKVRVKITPKFGIK